jgi:spermidine synthase
MKQKRPSRKPVPKPEEPAPEAPSTPPGGLFWLLAGLSGFACLIYQILWMRQAGLLLGNTSHAAALTLAVFFGGLSLGGWQWGKRCGAIARPLRAYAWLELGIAASGIVLLLAPVIIPRVYPMLGGGFALTAFGLALAVLMVFPASFLMGGTLPVLGQAVIRRKETFGTTTARMYAVNTLGAACGAFATAFVLIGWLGIRMTCVTAMAASVAAAFIALRLSRRECFPTPPEQKPRARTQPPGATILPRPLIVGFAFVSGFNLLALEVVWTRMLAQIHENSVYGFATVLIVVLACLSLGAWLASRLARGGVPAARILLWLFALGGASLALTPVVSLAVTGGMQMLATDFPFAGYMLRLFATAAAAIAPACLPLGAVFPLLMKGEEAFVTHAGKSIGTLSAVNTVGAILGALAAGFLLLGGLGVWPTIQLIAAVYLLLAIVTPASGSRATRAVRVAAVVMLVLVFTALDPSRLSAPAGSGKHGRVVETWEGSDCTVTVNEHGLRRYSIRINSNYSLGSTDAYAPQMFQARIPLLAWPATESVFFLGMGTGITAGEALSRADFPRVRKVVASELSPGVVAASRKYFTAGPDGFDLTNGLFTDPRASVVIGDGRNRLMADREHYSMINADLFLPYRRGTGNLYSREHFQTVRQRLTPGGVFVQWLPLYQVSATEFGIIANTMISVFPQVSLWRGNFQPGAEVAALVGHADSTPLPASDLDAAEDMRHAVAGATHLNMQELMLPINPRTVPLFYGGNLTRAADLFAKYPLNTDDKPVIEFGTPRSLHQPKGADRPQFLETRFADLVDRLQARTPPDQDPLLANRSPADRKLPLAGSAFHRGWIARARGDEQRWMAEWETFLSEWTAAQVP